MSESVAGTDGVKALPISEVLAGLRIPAVPPGSTPLGVLALIKLDEGDGSVGWVVRVSAGLDDDEVLGVLTGYTEHLRQVAAASWDEGDPTRASD